MAHLRPYGEKTAMASFRLWYNRLQHWRRGCHKLKRWSRGYRKWKLLYQSTSSRLINSPSNRNATSQMALHLKRGFNPIRFRPLSYRSFVEQEFKWSLSECSLPKESNDISVKPTPLLVSSERLPSKLEK